MALQDEEQVILNTGEGESDGDDDRDKGGEDDSSAPPPYRLFARESDDGEAKSVKDDADSSVDGKDGLWEDLSGLSIDGREGAAERRKEIFPVSSLKGGPSYDGAVGRSTLLKQTDPFASGAADGKASRMPSLFPPPLVSSRVFSASDGARAVVKTQHRAGEAGGASTRARDDARPAGRTRHMNSR